MWLFTPRGFYSVGQKPEDIADDCVVVRARNRADLENLGDLITEPIEHSMDGDYEYRIRCPREDWATACATMAREISYPKFKDRVDQVQGPSRYSTYLRCWSVLLDLEEPGRYPSLRDDVDEPVWAQAWADESQWEEAA